MKKIFASIRPDMCDLILKNAEVGEPFTKTVCGVIPTDTPGNFNCQVGEYERTFVNVSVECGNSFEVGAEHINRFMTGGNRIYGIFDDKATILNKLWEMLSAKRDDLENQLQRHKECTIKAIRTVNEFFGGSGNE